VTKSRKASNRKNGRGGKAGQIDHRATNRSRNVLHVDEKQTPLEVLFNDVLSRGSKRESTENRRKRRDLSASVSSQTISPPVRAALYVRVSKDASVKSDLSMPDQEAQLRKYCKQEDYRVAAVYYEPGKSAQSTARKEFRRMLRDASREGEPPFDKILIPIVAERLPQKEVGDFNRL
jgi:site-specific DNA recombinase